MPREHISQIEEILKPAMLRACSHKLCDDTQATPREVQSGKMDTKSNSYFMLL